MHEVHKRRANLIAAVLFEKQRKVRKVLSPDGDLLLFAQKEVSKKRCRNSNARRRCTMVEISEAGDARGEIRGVKRLHHDTSPHTAGNFGGQRAKTKKEISL